MFVIPLMPGFLVYILVTGLQVTRDINGWQPGPIGQRGRIADNIRFVDLLDTTCLLDLQKGEEDSGRNKKLKPTTYINHMRVILIFDI